MSRKNLKDGYQQAIREVSREKTRIATSQEKGPRVRDNTVAAIRTDLDDVSAKKIELPENASSFIIYHLEAGEFVYIGDNTSITSSSESAPLESGYRFQVDLAKGNDNALYGISSSGTITVFAIGVYRE